MVTKILKFSAEWCGPCRRLKENLKDMDFPMDEINIDENPEMVEEYNIISIPTLIYLDENGKTVYRSVGIVTKESILKKIDELNETQRD